MTTHPAPDPRRRPGPVPRTATLLALTLLLPSAPAAAHAPAPQLPRTSPDCATGSPAWTPAVAEPTGPADAYHPYVGNGYLGVRVPPSGSGYAEPGGATGWPLYTPRYDGAFVSGLYGRGPENTAGRDAIAALPNWTGLEVTAGGHTYDPGTAADRSGRSGRITDYRQALSLRCGFLRTSLTWTAPDGRRTDLEYDVLTDRAEAHLGAVRLRMTPHWNGRAEVTDRVDGRGARRITPAEGGGAVGKDSLAVTFRTDGEDSNSGGTRDNGDEGAVVSTLRAPGPVHPARPASGLTATQRAVLDVRAGETYEITKYVGVDTTLTSRTPRDSAREVSLRAAATGWNALFERHTAAWRELWSSDIEIPADAELQLWLRSAQYGLLSALRPGARNSVAPTGLSSDDYAGMIFWDAETWMFPGLLATRPELARPVLDYRDRTRPAAAANASRTSVKGLFYPWTSARRGDLWAECQSWRPPHCVTQNHLQGDIALAAWQYYLATGDLDWLRERGGPLLRGIAEYWASRVTANPDGSYSIKEVAGPDEYSNGVDDGAYTNAVAATALRYAVLAARELGGTAPAGWTAIADGLRIPYDPARKVFLQYDGYTGTRIKQADTVLLVYPLEWPMPEGAAAATLDYYTARTDLDGPAMTDSVYAIAAAATGEPGCAAYTFLQRASRPYFRGPFALFSEARGDKAGADDPLSGSPAQDFLTGKGGFLQVFTHGLTGLRPRPDAVRLDPTLPPQLAAGERGVTLRGLRWRGRAYDVAIDPEETTVRLRSGDPFPVDSPQGRFTVTRDRPAVLKTRRPDLTPTDDLARCRPVTATSEEPGLYATAAVDGNAATEWRPQVPGASLTVDLGRVTPVREVLVRGTEAFHVELSADGTRWTPYTSGSDATPARQVRVTLTGTSVDTGITEVVVR
ncbi:MULTISPECIES: glycosyl hydrolase family 65 protein [unclassified Streptomyces]|uniref:glycosyl hydrolase family 65 protein n=1 Tax=unclassified Streptomyces TaxID=2593676 RepID=UPI000823D577|nr:glycosyl hydrolase family 65 protein [Streptomyces sp. AmelKG-E11A]SCK16555.1 Trehalose and maltose hydrolase (possible phosphorylase) [Streptomyces sp. AmelKG-E11A]